MDVGVILGLIPAGRHSSRNKLKNMLKVSILDLGTWKKVGGGLLWAPGLQLVGQPGPSIYLSISLSRPPPPTHTHTHTV